MLERLSDGIFLLNKTTGLSSNQALQRVKWLLKPLGIKRAGHGGSLDPLAMGVLPICLNEATKFAQFFLDAHKSYRFQARLGICTDTGDKEGAVTEQKTVPPLSHEQLKALFEQFTGVIQQVPPMHSALKHQGRPLYEYARQGIVLDRPPREVDIVELKFLQFEQETALLEGELTCSKGTYVRTLVEDLGRALGCGACLEHLVRLKVGHFAIEQTMTLDALQEALEWGAALEPAYVPLEVLLSHYPSIQLEEMEGKRFLNGQSIRIQRKESEGDLVQVFVRGRWVGMATWKGEEELIPKRLVAAT